MKERSVAMSWGDASRYYAASMTGMCGSPDRADEQTDRVWEEALERASPGIRDVVERTYKQWNTILRDYLRNETALRLSMGGESHSVPVRVVGGMPRSIAEVMRRFQGLEWLLLNRPAVAAAASGTRFMESHVDLARLALGDAAGPSDAGEIGRVRETAANWLRRLDELLAVEQIIGIDEDVLGAYFFRIPEIRLYWVVIGITARALGVAADALTIVVLAHELAHAYTHLGRDIDNERWDTELFSKCDVNIVEGLAQFYAEVLCRRLDQRMPAALEAYQTLLDKQSGAYRAHLKWVGDDERSGEIVRVAMIECRSRGITAASEFAATVKRHRSGVRGRNAQ